MIVSVVSMPEGTVARASLSQAREHLAASGFVIVDVERGAEPWTEDQPLSRMLGLEAEGWTWLGTESEPERAEFHGGGAGFVVPVIQADEVTHVHVVVSEQYLITVHQEPVELIDTFTSRLPHDRPSDPVIALFLLLQGALETFRRATRQTLLEVEDIEDEMLQERRQQQILGLALLRRRAARLHRAFLPYSEATQQVLTRRTAGSDVSEQRQTMNRSYQSDMQQVLANIESLQDAARRASGSYSSLVADEQNHVINRLTIVSTIFLPLSYLTGFFGMDFSYLTSGLTGKGAFWLLGIGLQVVAVAGSLYVLKRRQLWRHMRNNGSRDAPD
ncbi:magnesium transporter CorA family protein [Streptomyces sp. NPDC054841]